MVSKIFAVFFTPPPILEDYFVNGFVYEKPVNIFSGNIVGKEKQRKDKTLRPSMEADY